MARKFVYDGRDFGDPLPGASINEVRSALAEYMSELVNAEHSTKMEGDTEVITFTRRIGTKGAAKADDYARLIEALETVPEKRLRVFDLFEKVYNPEIGSVDLARLSKAQPELNLAKLEVDTLTERIGALRKFLAALAPR